MTMNPRYRSLTGLKQAATAMEALHGALKFGLERDPLPSDTQGLEPLIMGAKGVLRILDGIDAISAEQELLDRQLLALEVAASASTVGRHHLLALQETAKTIQEKLKTNISEAQAEIEQMRDKLLAEMPLPNDADSKRLGRYRAQIENSMSRLMGVLDQTKTISKKSKKTGDARRRSFGSGISGPTVTLRVLK